MPIYVFRCADCDAESEALLALGDTSVRPCPDCGGRMRQKFTRVAIKFNAFGFTQTDKLVKNPETKNFKALNTKAQELTDS